MVLNRYICITAISSWWSEHLSTPVFVLEIFLFDIRLDTTALLLQVYACCLSTILLSNYLCSSIWSVSLAYIWIMVSFSFIHSAHLHSLIEEFNLFYLSYYLYSNVYLPFFLYFYVCLTAFLYLSSSITAFVLNLYFVLYLLSSVLLHAYWTIFLVIYLEILMHII